MSKTKIEEGRAQTKPSSSAHNFPIVGIGASAGGLDAFKQLLKAIPVDSEMAYVLVQHLNPAHESNLTEILSRVTKIPIQEITDDVKIFPNHIYVMPSGKILTSIDGVLKLTPRDSVKTNLVIDVFFTSLAVVWESMAVGVVLSGTGADGLVGLKMIKEHGGTTIVQDESAAYGDMPQNAVDTDVVDFVLPAEKIPAQLLKINNAPAITHANGEEEPLTQNDEVVFKQMLQLLQQRSGVDFTYNRQSTVRRRIGRRMALHKRGNLADYLKFLRNDKVAQNELFQDMLIPVTSFFRDPQTFETLTEKVLPALLKSKPAEDTIRFWTAGCSTGEEAYSIAICLHEFLGKKLSGKKVQLFASDISEIAIKKARAGIYSKAAVQTVSKERLSNYFTKIDDSYQINKAVRDICVFANHNFLKDPPFAKIDLISCRNVLIYMEPFLRKKALTTFHYALKENGTLLLGKSETVSATSELFTSFDKQHKIYSRKAGAGRFMQVATGRREETLTTQNTEAKKEAPQTDFRNSADAILLSKSPAGVVINEEMNIVYIHGDTSAFINPAPGKPSFNLLKMAREGLAFELRNAIHKAKTSKAPVIKEEIPVNENSKQSLVTIEIFPLMDTVEPHYLILFTKIHLPATPSPKERAGVRSLKNDEALKRNEQLEKELVHTREDMRSITEEMERTNEELQSANEEPQSSNEEMQSLNEELETSKEERQSSNEELTTVNQELIDKQEQLNVTRDYFKDIVGTLKEPLLVLDKNLRIKSANDSFYKKFNITETETEGKLFYELQNYQWNNNELRKLLENIIPQKSRIEDFEMILDEHIMLLSARQILNQQNTEQLILLAIEDVTDSRLAKKLKESEARLARERQVLYNSFMNAPVSIGILKGDTHIYEFSNAENEKLTDKKITIGKTVQELFPEVERQGYIQLLNIVFSTGEPFIGNELPVDLKRKEDGIVVKRYVNVVVQPLKDEKENTEGLVTYAIDITEQVEARKKIEVNEAFNRTILESSPDCLKVLDSEGRIQFMNVNGLCQMEIDDFSTVENKNWWTLWGSENEALVKASIDKVLTGETAHFTALCPTAKGTPKWWDVVVSPVGKPGEPVQQIISVSRDITEQKAAEEKIKESEKQFRIFADSIQNLAWIASADGLTYWYNQRWYDYTGTTFDETKDWGWEKVHHPDHIERVITFTKEALKKAEACEVTYPLRRHDGEYRWFLTCVYPVKDANGTIERWIGTSTDITEQKSFTEALEEKVKERTEELKTKNLALELTNAELASFSFIASHDLKEPLRKIQTFSKLITDTEKFSDKTQDYFNRIISAVARMQNLIDSLLNLSRTNTTELIFVPCDLNTIVDESIIDLNLSILEKQATVDYENLPIIMGVYTQMSQLFTNLIGNAIKYSRPEIKPHIKITSSIAEGKEIDHPSANKQKDYYVITIADNGIGFEKEYATKIFKLFQRLHNKNEYSGTGIGLAIVKKIVTNHNGFIMAEGNPNIGSTFTIYFPNP